MMECLKIDNSKELVKKIGLLFNNEELSDIQLDVLSEENQTFYAHKFILCCHSEVFRIMLTGGNWLENQTNHITLHEEVNCMPHFSVFLAYLYTGCIYLDPTNVLPHLMLADKYAVEDLQAVCINYMMTNQVSLLDNTHTLAWFEYASISHHQDLYEACRNYALYNFERIIESDDFLLANIQTIYYFLCDSDLIIHSEFVLFEAIEKWCRHKSNAEQFDEESFLLLFSEIRLPFLSPFELDKLLHLNNLPSNILKAIDNRIKEMTAYYEFLSNRLNNGVSEMDNFSPSHLIPRTYTENNWCTTLNIENFTTLPLHAARSIHFSSPVLTINKNITENDLESTLSNQNKKVNSGPTLINWDWTLEIFPKGLTFKPCIMIGIWRNLDVPGADYNSMCLALSTLSKNTERRKVRVVIMITGKHAGIEYISECIQRDWVFDEEKRVQHIRDLLPHQCMDEDFQQCTSHISCIIKTKLNENAVPMKGTHPQEVAQTSAHAKFTNSQSKSTSPKKQPNLTTCLRHNYLSGPNNDCFKISIVIKPDNFYHFFSNT